jgi:hypothetical protein
VAGVQQVEAAVGEHDPPPEAALPRELGAQRLQVLQRRAGAGDRAHAGGLPGFLGGKPSGSLPGRTAAGVVELVGLGSIE